ncbi:hypothetical protein [Cellulomonas cellasea]|uniref:Uncharacterized protein n=1 Tax=Cellulomonas cellasea TaxID=43670 RepID=A0A7W4UBS4_9CELL|nr:hypothetical protein [Cellulomonas cellasea]MBB2921282.1 hypothetical protein [Cellulomonas cellasea]
MATQSEAAEALFSAAKAIAERATAETDTTKIERLGAAAKNLAEAGAWCIFPARDH